MSASRMAQAAIKIPKRIERGPTDILRALASTVKHVPNAPNHLLHDDPYLIPIRHNDAIEYSLSRLSGRNTAKFLLNKHPELFYRDDAEPKVRSFMPPEEYRDDMEFTEDDIRWCIEHRDSVNGIIAFKKLDASKIKISDSTLLDFFELLCYTNEEKLLDLDDYQKNYYSRESQQELVKQTWNKNGIVSKIFNDIKDKLDPPRVYSAMIAGLSKYNEHTSAKELFEEFKQQNSDVGLHVNAYESLISSIPNLNSSMAAAHDAIDEIVEHMRVNLVAPDLQLFNSILDVYSRFNCDEKTCLKAIQLVNNMRELRIEPSLFTYSALINTIYRCRYGRSYGNLVPSMLDYMNANQQILEIRDQRDIYAFNTLMRLFTTLAHSLQLANKLHKIFMKKPKFFLNESREFGYFDNYFRLIITTEKLDNIINFYDLYVPMHFRPSSEAYDSLAEALDLYQAEESVIKRIGSDIIQFGHGSKIKNDAIFRKHPSYVQALEDAQNYRQNRRSGDNNNRTRRNNK